ncbi:50S ribosomal protein L11 methyltransferase [Bartonella ancashensis]|uniref:Ribosomal protein L11 methyltransferase n=1 Tax=Bartonella ancashensis TaxID=1318743 RepID=A0A0M4L734_9HYPH|nr:50S ribosomal protein L11 methyltransferase [Bartonella ancashensis]ALE03633.1 Ribosomal protein L11 methyltransferase [Bartonella ancashensis]
MSQQVRLYYVTSKNEAERCYDFIERSFDEEGYPISLAEIDEKNAVYEISLYVSADDQENIHQRLADILSLEKDSISIEILPNIDWVKKSLEELKPVNASFFFIHGSHDRDNIPPNVLPIEIEANQAFGTGHHGTTSGCLEMIAKIMSSENPKNALDLGTGSGILAIAIAMLKHIPVLASDIDPIATQVAQCNIRLNGVEKYVTAITAVGFDHNQENILRGPFDLIVANILANPLIEFAQNIAHALQKNGSIILSGILEEQRDQILDAYMQQGLKHIETYHRSGWVTLHLK